MPVIISNEEQEFRARHRESYVTVKGRALTLPEAKSLRFFIYSSGFWWHICEVSTGLGLNRHSCFEKSAITSARKRIKTVGVQNIKNRIKEVLATEQPQ